MRSSCRVLLLTALLNCSGLAQTTATPILTLDLTKIQGKVSPILYGLMTEEINYSYDGGLYAELIRNRSFRDNGRGQPFHWFIYETGNADASMAMDTSTGPSAALPISAAVTVRAANEKEQAGITNEGYWGMRIDPRTTYNGFIYLKASSANMGPVQVSLIHNSNGEVLAHTTIPAITSNWKQYPFALTSGASSASSENRLVFSVSRPGRIWFGLSSLFPPTYHNRKNGNRIDLMQTLADMKPAFLRFPGGDYLEGSLIDNRFQWKKTIGPFEDRPTHRSPWGYVSSDGMGLLEFLEWCEDLHMEPVLGLYAGYSKQQRVQTEKELEPFVAEALEEIEYVIGDVHTTWGAARARDGHPEPFALHYVEVGNEDYHDLSGSYQMRFPPFFQAIRKKYPQLKIIATTPVHGEAVPDVVDDHFYRTASQFFDDNTHYDQADRKGPKIFVGEWATIEGGPTPNFNAALGDAAWMTGMERNSDLVIMSCYAPLFVNINTGGTQWQPDLIGYDAMTSYGSPSYYAQVLFSNHLGDEIPGSHLESAPVRFFYSVTRNSKSGTMYLKLVNASDQPRPIQLQILGGTSISQTGKRFLLSARSPLETNSIEKPRSIVPVEGTITDISRHFAHTVPPYTIEVLEFGTGR